MDASRLLYSKYCARSFPFDRAGLDGPILVFIGPELGTVWANATLLIGRKHKWSSFGHENLRMNGSQKLLPRSNLESKMLPPFSFTRFGHPHGPHLVTRTSVYNLPPCI